MIWWIIWSLFILTLKTNTLPFFNSIKDADLNFSIWRGIKYTNIRWSMNEKSVMRIGSEVLLLSGTTRQKESLIGFWRQMMTVKLTPWQRILALIWTCSPTSVGQAICLLLPFFVQICFDQVLVVNLLLKELLLESVDVLHRYLSSKKRFKIKVTQMGLFRPRACAKN